MDATEPEILTEPERQRRERDNLLATLRKANWKIKGADGAAERLGVKATTLKARIKKMGLRRPDQLFADRRKSKSRSPGDDRRGDFAGDFFLRRDVCKFVQRNHVAMIKVFIDGGFVSSFCR